MVVSCDAPGTPSMHAPEAAAAPGYDLASLTKRLRQALSSLSLASSHQQQDDCGQPKSGGRDQQHKAAPSRRHAGGDEPKAGHGYHPEYLDSCYEDEPKAAADWRYLGGSQPQLDAHQRLVLVDWLVEVVDEFKLSQSTLFLAVNLVDRYLGSAPPIPGSSLQLVGVSALWLASKFLEAYPPVLADFVDVTQAACGGEQLIATEAALLRVLGFTLMVPTAHTFLGLFMPAAAANAADADAALSAAIDGDLPSCGDDSDDGAGSDAPGCGRDSSSSSSSSSCSSSGSSSDGSSCGGSLSGRFRGGGRVPPADAATGPRAAPRYPYAIGSPCPAPLGGGAAKGAGGGGAAAAAAGASTLGAVGAGALGDFPRRVAHMAEYLAELSLLSPECMRYPPSLIAAAALHVACALLGAPPGARARLAPAAEGAAARAGDGGEERLRSAAAELRRMFRYASRAPRPPATRAKYACGRRSCVATVPLPDGDDA